LLDRKSPRSIGILSFSCAIAATYILAISNNILFCTLARALQGVASAMSLLLCIRIASMWFNNTKGYAIGCMFAMASLGGMSANLIMPHVVALSNWRHALVLSGNIGLVFLVVMICFLTVPQNHNEDYSERLFFVFKSSVKKILSLGIYIGFMTLPIFILGTLWGSLFLVNVYHITHNAAGIICAFLFIGMIIGTPMFGWLYDITNKPSLLMAICSINSAIITILLIIGTFQSFIALKILFFMLGISSSSSTIAFALLANAYSFKLRSSIIAIAALIENMIGTMAQPLFGWIIDIGRNFNLSSILSYKIALLILPLAFCICYSISLLIKTQLDLTIRVIDYDAQY
jgi:MFS family permease